VEAFAISIKETTTKVCFKKLFGGKKLGEQRIIQVGNVRPVSGEGTDIDVRLDMQRRSTLFHTPPPAIARDEDLHYGGHVIWANPIQAFDVHTGINATDTEITVAGQSTPENVDMHNWIPSTLPEVSGIMITTQLSFYLAATKVLATTYLQGILSFSLVYGGTPETYTAIAGIARQGMAAGVEQKGYIWTQAQVPVIYHNGVPYIVYALTYAIQNMDSNSASYWISATSHLLGFYK